MGGMGRRQPAGIMEKTLDLSLAQRLDGLPRWRTGEESACNAGDLGDAHTESATTEAAWQQQRQHYYFSLKIILRII